MTHLNHIKLGLIALLTIIVVVAVFAVEYVDLKRQKALIESIVLEQTGRELQINGAVTANLFPWFGLSLTDVLMANAEEFSDTEFATVSSGELQLYVLPLLTGDIKLKKVVLRGLSLNLQRDADGKTNWDDLMATTAVVETKSDDNVVQEIEAGAPLIAALSAGDVQIVDSKVAYTDERDASFLAVNELNVNTGTVVLSEPFAFEANFDFITSAASGLTSVVTSSGEIAVDLVNNIYALRDLKLSTVSSGAALPLESLPFSSNGELVADLNNQTIDIKVTDGLLSGVSLSGEIHATDLQDKPRLSGMLMSGDFDAASAVEQLNIAGLDQFPTELLQKSRFSVQFEYLQDVLHLQNFEASVNDINLTGDFQIAHPAGPGVFSGWLRTDPFNPAPWLDSFELAFEDDSVMQQAQLLVDIRQSGELLSFNQIDLQLDDSHITGSVQFSDINTDTRSVTYDVSVDQINLDSYVPLIANTTATDAENKPLEPLLSVDTLRQLTAEGKLSFGEMTLAGMVAQNVEVPLLAENGRLEITRVKADLYSGSLFAAASLDVQSDEPLLTVTGNMNGLNADRWLHDVFDKEAPFSGVANLSMDLLSRVPASRGFGLSQFLEHASGALSLRVTDGELKGIDIAAELRDVGRQISDGVVVHDSAGTETTQDVLPVTEFSEYSLSAVLADGVLKSDDLVFLSPLVQLTGEGGVNVSTHTVDVLLHLTVTSGEQTAQDEALHRLAGNEYAIPIRGLYTDLSVDLPQLLLKTFQSGLTSEVESRYTGQSDSVQQSTKQTILSEKEALRRRLEAEQQEAAEIIRQKQQLETIPVEETQQQEPDKNALKDRLQNNLKEDLDELLSEN